MKMTSSLILMLAGLASCKDMDPRQPRELGPAQIVALAVRTEPPGAIVKVNRLAKTWTSPCDIADYSLGKGILDVEVSMPGYQTVTMKPRYDGFEPVTLELRLVRVGAAAEPAPAVPVARPVAVPKASEPAPAPVKVEPVAGGTRLKISSANSKVRIQAKAVVTDAEKPGEYLVPHSPPDRVVVEFLDPKTDAVLQAVEIVPPAAAPVAAKPVEVPAVEADRVGEVKVASNTYGVYVKLDPGLELQPGEELLIYRDGKEVGRTKILKITKADPKYPDGGAQLQKDGTIQKGDEVRRQKP